MEMIDKIVAYAYLENVPITIEIVEKAIDDKK